MCRRILHAFTSYQLIPKSHRRNSNQESEGISICSQITLSLSLCNRLSSKNFSRNETLDIGCMVWRLTQSEDDRVLRRRPISDSLVHPPRENRGEKTMIPQLASRSIDCSLRKLNSITLFQRKSYNVFQIALSRNFTKNLCRRRSDGEARFGLVRFQQSRMLNRNRGLIE